MTKRISLLGLSTLTRRRAMVCITAVAGMQAFAPRPACAVLQPRYAQPVPIALPDFLASSPVDADPARAISQIIAANLKRTEQFALIDQALFLERITNFDVAPRFPDWRAINVDALVTGRVTRQPDGRLQVAFRLWDVAANAQLTGLQYLSTPDNLRRIANIISDAIYERLTGEKGNFDASTSP